MKFDFQTVFNVFIALVIFKVADRLFLNSMVEKIGQNFDEAFDSE